MGRKLWRGQKLWRIHGQLRWLPFGEDFYLGGGYHQAARLARTCARCDEPGCGQVIGKGEVCIDYWRGQRHEAFCLGHAPIPIDLVWRDDCDVEQTLSKAHGNVRGR